MHLSVKKEIFNDAYLPYLEDYTRKWEIYYGGAGSGKSVFVAQKLVWKALKSYRHILVVRKENTTIKDSCWPLVISVLSKFKILDKCKINKSEQTITLPPPYYSVFRFRGLDDPEKIKSIVDLSDCWIEEPTAITLMDWKQLKLRVRGKFDDKQYFLSFNPISKSNWVYAEFFNDGSPRHPHMDDTFILKTTYRDNKFLPEDQIETILGYKENDPAYYAIYGEGEFCTLEPLVFVKGSNWIVEDFNQDNIQGIGFVGVDWGYVNDPCGLVWGKINEKERKIWIFGEDAYRTGITNDEMAAIIKARGLHKEIIYADYSDSKSIQELKTKHDITRIRPATKGPDSIIHGISFIKQFKTIVHPTCVNFISELNEYAWELDKNGVPTNVPKDSKNHLLDAWRYGLEIVQAYKGGSFHNKETQGIW